jgi:serine/threonine-protein kinase
MDDSRQPSACPYCGQRDALRPVAERLGRCSACSFVLPTPRASGTEVARPVPLEIPGIAPGGLLRSKYRLIERLGEGAHGVTYLAEHEYLSHPCVVKILPQRTGDATDSAVCRLRNEARAGFTVQDPNVIRVLDCDVVLGVWYFVMEYVDGVNLAALFPLKQRLAWQQAVQVGSDAAQGLAAIHRAGLLHRDIKPGNLILGVDGRVRVADLGVAGLAHERRDDSSLAMAGTLPYTAPEVFRPDAPIGPPADLYSLGVTLYHLVTGRLPHASTQLFQRLIDLQCRPAVWPDEAAPDVPRWLVDVILRLLAIEPRDRFDSTGALIEQLRPPAARADRPRPLFQPDTLQPRGIGVLPLENERDAPDDDWLGYAVANHLSRALSELPDVYVADQDGLIAVAKRMQVPGEESPKDRLLEAGRMVGAATIVTGRFQRDGGTVRICAEVLRVGREGPGAMARAEGPLADLPDLERVLFDRLAQVLGLRGAGQERPRAPMLAAREKFVLGKQAYLCGEYEQAIALAEEAVRLDPDFAEAIGFAGVCLARLGRYDAADVQHRRQLALGQQWGDERPQIEALANLGVMNYFRGDYEAAESHYREAARLAEERGLATESAQISNNLGFVLFRRGRLAEAEKAFSRAIETHRAYGGLASLIGPYNGMGNVLAEQERHEEARSFYRRALSLATEIGDRASVGTTHMHLGRSAVLEGRFADAKHEFTMALNALEETRFWNGLARAYGYVADMHLQLGNFEEAMRCADQRIELARQHANVRMEAAAWLQKAESLRRAGRPEEATECLARAGDAGVGPAASS